MLAARLVNAGKTGFGSVLFSVFLQMCLGLLIRLFIVNELAAVVIAVIGGSVIYSLVLDTTILRGFAISLLSVTIVVIAAILLSGVFGVFK